MNPTALNCIIKFSCHLNVLLLSVSITAAAGSWLLTPISHHDFLDGPVHRLRCGVGEAGEDTRPPHSQQADATLDCDVLQHPGRQRGKEIEHPTWTLWGSRLALVQSGTKINNISASDKITDAKWCKFQVVKLKREKKIVVMWCQCRNFWWINRKMLFWCWFWWILMLWAELQILTELNTEESCFCENVFKQSKKNWLILKVIFEIIKKTERGGRSKSDSQSAAAVALPSPSRLPPSFTGIQLAAD